MTAKKSKRNLSPEAAARVKRTQFKKGQVNNPNGRPAFPEKIKGKAKLTHTDLVEQVTDLWFRDVPELTSIVKKALSQGEGEKGAMTGGKGISAGRAMIASVMVHAIKDGDSKRLDMLLNRVIGRPAETIKLMGAFAHKHLHVVPVAEILKNPEMAERALALAEFTAQKSLEAPKPEGIEEVMQAIEDVEEIPEEIVGAS